MKKTLFTLTLLLSFPAFSLCVIQDRANLRAGPGKRYKKTWTVGKYTPLILVKYRRGWYKVKDMDGQIHWIYSGLASQKTKCMSVKVRKANIRKGPGINHAQVAYKSVDRYTPLRKLNKKGAWYQVADSAGTKFWIHERNVWRPITVSKVSF